MHRCTEAVTLQKTVQVYEKKTKKLGSNWPSGLIMNYKNGKPAEQTTTGSVCVLTPAKQKKQ